ncbi:MAG: cation diffusion facilitator family transporter [Alphaproteobacteria bacterium]|jgi:cobalt-zinc-cadmium efflux system protein|tara:strand:+ start:1579 stop:2484 length:906 start_codon:yes stop_codon:yes gene_type:complete
MDLHHGHNHHSKDSDRNLFVAIILNVLLSVSQIIGGIISGSLSLIADALHNFSDAASLCIALFARTVSRRPPDTLKTFGYQRADTIAALINLTLLIVIGLYIAYEGVIRLANPQQVTGWIIILVAGIALIIDVFTAMITHRISKNNMNMRAAFLHNLSDALSSVSVIIAGVLIILFEWYWTDTVLTFMISAFVLWQGITMLPKTIHLLMEGTPIGLSLEDIKLCMNEVSGVENIHHLHVWNLDENRIALEAHVVMMVSELKEVKVIKDEIKSKLKNKFNITHSTLEFEYYLDISCDENTED